MELNEKQIQQTLSFLKEYSFIIMNETLGEIKLKEMVRRLLTKTDTS